MRFWHLGHQGFWFDEGYSALLVHQRPGEMLHLLRHSESTPPLYYCVAWVWVRVFGFGEAGLRSLSALAGTATVPLLYLAGTRFVSRRAGLVGAALAATNPLLIWYSQEARSYALLAMFSAATLAALPAALGRPGRRPLAIWAVLSALALATHYYAVLVVVPQAVMLLWCRRRSALPAVAGVAVIGLGLLPLAILQQQDNLVSWIHHIPPDARLTQLLPTFVLGFAGPAYNPLTRGIALLGALGVLWLAVGPVGPGGPGDRARGGAVRCAQLLAGGVVVQLLLLAAGVDDLLTRNVIALWVPAALVVAIGLSELPPRTRAARRLGDAAVAAICAAGMVAAIGVAIERRWQRPDWRVVARLIRPGSPQAGVPRAVLVQNSGALLPLELYLPHLHFWPGAHDGAGAGRTIRVREIDIVAFTAPRASLCWYGAACNLDGSRTQRRYAIRGFHELWRRHALQFTVVHLAAARPTPINLAIVGRALRTTRMASDELLKLG